MSTEHRVVKEDFICKLRSEQRLEGGEEVSHVNVGRKNIIEWSSLGKFKKKKKQQLAMCLDHKWAREKEDEFREAQGS